MQEPNVLGGVSDDKKTSLLRMNFSLDVVEFAMDKLGMWNFLYLMIYVRKNKPTICAFILLFNT